MRYLVFDRAVCGFVPIMHPIRQAAAWAIVYPNGVCFEPSIKREIDEIIFQEPVLCAFEPVEKTGRGYKCAIKSFCVDKNSQSVDFYVNAESNERLELKGLYEGVLAIKGGAIHLGECRRVSNANKPLKVDLKSFLKIAGVLGFQFGLSKRGTTIKLTLEEKPEATWLIRRDGRVQIQCNLCYKEYLSRTLDGQVAGPFSYHKCQERPCIVFPKSRVQGRRQLLNAISIMKTIRMKKLNSSVVSCEKLRHYYKPYFGDQTTYPPCQDCIYQYESFCRNPHIPPVHRLRNTNRPPAICNWRRTHDTIIAF